MKEISGAQIVARQLQLAGIDTIFGVMAGPMIEIFVAAQEAGIRVVTCRHEESAGFMASAWGYVQKKPGVVVVGSGPGMTNVVTPMHVATESAMPLVVLGGSVYGVMSGIGGFQEADQLAFARPGCKWLRQIESTERIPELLHLALGKSVSGRPGAVYLDFPGQMVSRQVASKKVQFRNSIPQIISPHPDPNMIEQVSDMLAFAERPLVVVGKGAAWSDAGSALVQLVDLGLPFVATPMGRGTIPDDHPNFMNSARSMALKDADVILMVGARFNWMFQFGKTPAIAENARIVQIDIHAEEIFSGAEVEVGIIADAKTSVIYLYNALKNRAIRSSDGQWLAALATKREKNQAELEGEMADDSEPIKPYYLLGEIRDLIPRNATVSVDGEIIMGVARQVIPGFEARARLNAGTTGCIGTGVPYAIGAKLARPGGASVAILGDYAFGAAGMEIETAARVGANVVFLVANNEGVEGHTIQNKLFSSDAPPIAALLPARYEKMAEMVGGHAELVERPDQVRPAFKRALNSGKVSLVHVRVDPMARGARGGLKRLKTGL